MTEITKVDKWTSPDGEKTRYYVTLDDGTEAVSFNPVAEGPLPEGWTLEPPKQAGWKPMLKAPAPQRSSGGGGFKAAWANTEEGEKYVQERMDRRTAVMQAMTLVPTHGYHLDIADDIYTWLRRNLDVSASPAGREAPAGGADTPSDGGGAGEKAPPSSAKSRPGEEVGRGGQSGRTFAAKWTPRKNEPPRGDE